MVTISSKVAKVTKPYNLLKSRGVRAIIAMVALIGVFILVIGLPAFMLVLCKFDKWGVEVSF